MRVSLLVRWAPELQHDPWIFWHCIIISDIVKKAPSPPLLLNAFCHQISMLSQVLGAFLLVGDNNLSTFSASLSSIIFSVCFGGNYHLRMQKKPEGKRLLFPCHGIHFKALSFSGQTSTPDFWSSSSACSSVFVRAARGKRVVLT